MCGLIGYISKTKNTAPDAIINQYQDQHLRGKEGFGMIEIDKKLNQTIKRATEPTKAIMDIYNSKADIILFHHRYPTSTKNKIAQTHPIHVSHPELTKDYYVLHNGVIYNNNELFKLHTEEYGYAYSTLEAGYQYESHYGQYKSQDKFNDSEAFAIAIARYLEGKDKELDVRGSIAFIATAVNKKTNQAETLIYGRNQSNPIEIRETKEGLLIASNIDDIEAEILPDNTIEKINLKKLFQKNLPKNLLGSNLITQQELIIKKEPEKPIGFGSYQNRFNRTPTAAYHQTPKNLFNNVTKEKNITETTKTKEVFPPKPAPIFENEKDSFANIQTTREKEFEKIANRVIRDISEEMYDLFADMAYAPVTDTEITEVVSRIKDLILEKETVAETILRPKFEQEEEISELKLQEILNQEDEANEETEYSKEETYTDKNFKTPTIF